MSTEVKEQTNQNAEKKSKKTLIIVGGIVIGAAIVILSIFLIISFNKQNEYNNAVEMYNEKQFEQAVVVFSELNTYMDSQQYLDKCYIGSGDVFLEGKNYENARAEYNKINDNDLKTEMLMKCDYSEAEQMFQDKKYKEALTVFEALGTYSDSAAYVEKCKYSDAVQMFQDKKYKEALSVFEALGTYSDSAAYVKKCKYSDAEQMFQDKKYKEALSVFEALGTYSDSAAYVNKCKTQIKFSKFDFSGENYQGFYSIYGGGDKIANADAAEKKLSFLYGTWYDENDNKFEITSTLLNGKEYGVCAIGFMSALIYFYDDENSILRFAVSGDMILGANLFCYPSATASSATEMYRSVTSAEMDAEIARIQEEQQKIPNYSDSEVIDLASSKTEEKLRGMYRALGYSGAEMIYHVYQVNSSSVSYDWTTRTYTCYLYVSYSTNIFDVFGTSTSYYDVVATYEDTGAGLVSTGFSIS